MPEKVEFCGSREMALTKYKELAKYKDCQLNVAVHVKGETIAQNIVVVGIGVNGATSE